MAKTNIDALRQAAADAYEAYAQAVAKVEAAVDEAAATEAATDADAPPAE